MQNVGNISVCFTYTPVGIGS